MIWNHGVGPERHDVIRTVEEAERSAAKAYEILRAELLGIALAVGAVTMSVPSLAAQTLSFGSNAQGGLSTEDPSNAVWSPAGTIADRLVAFNDDSPIETPLALTSPSGRRPESASPSPSPSPSVDSYQSWNFHFQTTTIVETAAPFRAPYSGYHSMDSEGALQETLSVDFMGGHRLWSGGEIHADMLVWQGYGLSTSFGIENFPDSDAYKAGTRPPNVMLSHLFLQHTFGFGGEQEDIPDSPLTLAGKSDISRLTLYLGRMTPLDIFDRNRYAGDGHLQFMSWGGAANMTWDYGQDTIGYGTGFMADFNQRTWALRYGFFLMPPYINAGNTGSGDGGEDQILTYPQRGRFGPVTKSWGMSVELEKRYDIDGHPGAVRPLLWADSARSVEYGLAAQVLSTLGTGTDLTPYEAYHHSYGVGLNVEQEISSGIGVFARLGWNDGKTQALEYTDANWGVSTGVALDGSLWNQPRQHGGVAVFLSGASKENQAYLRAGGLGILAGDSFLTYSAEKSLTPYYDIEFVPGLHFALQYQLTVDPAFNRDRGPISTVMFRFHYEL